VYYFSSLGHGYCPVTETVKHHNLMRNSGLKEFKFQGEKFLIPKHLEPSSNGTETRCERMTFENKEVYQRYKLSQYGLSAGIKLIVQASSEGRWVDEATESRRAKLVSVRQQTTESFNSRFEIYTNISVPSSGLYCINSRLLSKKKMFTSFMISSVNSELTWL